MSAHTSSGIKRRNSLDHKRFQPPEQDSENAQQATKRDKSNLADVTSLSNKTPRSEDATYSSVADVTRLKNRPPEHEDDMYSRIIVHPYIEQARQGKSTGIEDYNGKPILKGKSDVSSNGETHNESSNYLWIIVVALAAVLLAYFFFFLNKNEEQVTYHEPTRLERIKQTFEEDFKKTMVGYANQNKNTWRSIKAAVLTTISVEEPLTPGIVSFVANPASYRTAACLARNLAEILKRAYNDSQFVILHGSSYEKQDADWVKHTLDDEIKRGFQYGGHVVLLERLDLLPAKSGLLFHGLCDNENAPFKQAVYIFTIVINEATLKDHVNLEVTAAWKNNLSEDQRSSLETRIGNHIIVTDPESEEKLADLCR